MNILPLLLIGLAIYAFYDTSAPKVFKENKELLLSVFICLVIYRINIEGFTHTQCRSCCIQPEDNCYQSDTDPNLWGCRWPYYNLKQHPTCLNSHQTFDCPDPEDSDFQERVNSASSSSDRPYFNSAWNPVVYQVADAPATFNVGTFDAGINTHDFDKPRG